MIRRHLASLSAAGLLVVTGCGGGGEVGSPASPAGQTPAGTIESRTFDFTAAVIGAAPGPGGRLEDVAFFRDAALEQPGVELWLGAERLAGPEASEIGQQSRDPLPTGFSLAIMFDASSSIDEPSRDPGGLRFLAAEEVIAWVGDEVPGTGTRLFTFRAGYDRKFKLIPPGLFDADDAATRALAIENAQREKPTGGSPVLTATYNVVDALPQGSDEEPQPHVVLLLTDGENNSEDPTIAPHNIPCPEPDLWGCSDDTLAVHDLALDRDARLFVAGLGNEDDDLEKFRRLADETGGAYVKATGADELEAQFANLAAFMVGGGVIVQGRTAPVALASGAGPISISGWLRFRRIGGVCPLSSVPHDAEFCKVSF